MFVPFLSAALIFSSGPVFAQNLVNTIPDFYYLEDASDEFFSVRACSTPTAENNSIKTLDCPVVATISVSDLENFLADSSREAEDHYNHTKSHSQKLQYASLGMVFTGLIGVNITIGLAQTISKKAFYSSWYASILIMLGGLFSGSTHSRLTQKNRNHYQAQQTFEQQVRMGLVGSAPHHREAILQQFTDFINQYGVSPTPEAVETTSN